jgi:hypothetical protein
MIWKHHFEAAARHHDSLAKRYKPRMVRELDLFESNHDCGLNAPFHRKHPKRT